MADEIAGTSRNRIDPGKPRDFEDALNLAIEWVHQGVKETKPVGLPEANWFIHPDWILYAQPGFFMTSVHSRFYQSFKRRWHEFEPGKPAGRERWNREGPRVLDTAREVGHATSANAVKAGRARIEIEDFKYGLTTVTEACTVRNSDTKDDIEIRLVWCGG